MIEKKPATFLSSYKTASFQVHGPSNNIRKESNGGLCYLSRWETDVIYVDICKAFHMIPTEFLSLIRTRMDSVSGLLDGQSVDRMDATSRELYSQWHNVQMETRNQWYSSGSILGCILFNTVINDVHSNKPNECTLSQFVDNMPSINRTLSDGKCPHTQLACVNLMRAKLSNRN